MLEAIQNIIAGIIAAIMMFFSPPLGAPDTPYNLLISSLETEQEQCLKDTGRYCQIQPYWIGNLEIRVSARAGGKNGDDWRSYRIMTKEFPGPKETATSTMKIHEKGKPVVIIPSFVLDEKIIRSRQTI